MRSEAKSGDFDERGVEAGGSGGSREGEKAGTQNETGWNFGTGAGKAGDGVRAGGGEEGNQAGGWPGAGGGPGAGGWPGANAGSGGGGGSWKGATKVFLQFHTTGFAFCTFKEAAMTSPSK